MQLNNKDGIDLFEALLLLSSKQEAKNFFKDLCTPQEISALSERWRVCQLLEVGNFSYREIHALTGASLTTIGRVARFLKDEANNGYSVMLAKVKVINNE
jgi:TrpR-related protein YerC/YecD